MRRTRPHPARTRRAPSPRPQPPIPPDSFPLTVVHRLGGGPSQCTTVALGARTLGRIGTALGLTAVALLLLLTAFFVAAEFSFVAVDRSRIESMALHGHRGARLVERVIAHLPFHLSGTQLGITVTSLLLGFIAEPTVASVIENV